MSSDPGAADRRDEQERRRRAARLLGDLLPDVTSDERDADPREAAGSAASRDDDLRRDVPPHHGG